MIRVVLPHHLRELAGVGDEVEIEAGPAVTTASLLDALEARFPSLRGTIRDQQTGKRRPFVRFFACQRDLSHNPPGEILPNEVIRGTEPFLIIGAIAGG